MGILMRGSESLGSGWAKKNHRPQKDLSPKDGDLDYMGNILIAERLPLPAAAMLRREEDAFYRISQRVLLLTGTAGVPATAPCL
jgi:hypothetical protein